MPNTVGVPLPRYRKLIRRPRALSRRGLRWVFVACAGVSGAIGVGFSAIGAWLVLPFAGLETLVVGAALVLVARQRGDYELVVVDKERVHIVRRARGHRECVQLQRYWARVSLARGIYGWYPSRLLIKSHGRAVEVGAWMTDEAREALALELAAVMRAEPAVGHLAGREARP